MIPASLIAALRRAERVMVMTGAGVSAESGIPTFRDAGSGFWSMLRPEDLASREGYLRDPGRVWAWYADRRHQLRAAEPNAAHRALAEMERRLPALVLVTQNIDGLHQRAGSRRVLELHGNLGRVRCFDDDCYDGEMGIEVRDDPAEDDPAAIDTQANPQTSSDPQANPQTTSHPDPPRCPRCGAYLRPDIVWFGEMLPMRPLYAAIEASRQCDLFFSVGTSGLVEPAASLAFAALDRDVPVVEVNPEATPLTPYATHVLRGPAGDLLPELVRRAWGDGGGGSARDDGRSCE